MLSVVLSVLLSVVLSHENGTGDPSVHPRNEKKGAYSPILKNNDREGAHTNFFILHAPMQKSGSRTL